MLHANVVNLLQFLFVYICMDFYVLFFLYSCAQLIWVAMPNVQTSLMLSAKRWKTLDEARQPFQSHGDCNDRITPGEVVSGVRWQPTLLQVNQLDICTASLPRESLIYVFISSETLQAIFVDILSVFTILFEKCIKCNVIAACIAGQHLSYLFFSYFDFCQ